MKAVLVTAVGILFGETDEKDIEKSTTIIGSIWFGDEEVITKDKLQGFIQNKREEFLEYVGKISDEIISDEPEIIDFLRNENFNKARFASMGELAPFRTLITSYLNDHMDISKSDGLTELIRSKAMERTKLLLREKVEARDVYIAQAINSIDDINSILNLIYARLSEWYGIHFPELQDLVRDNTQYIKLISRTDGVIRSDLKQEHLEHLSDRRKDLILDAAGKSLGADISTYDMNPITQFATFGVEILKIKDSLESYIEESMKEVAPNIQCLVGSLLGARLIALAGSLENLAKSSSGTIQVLGAEKALFRHLRSGEDPPKHGVIFQSPFIHSAKRHQRGKIARTLAGKLSIASRVDFFSGEFIGPNLLEELEKRVKEIHTSFPEPSEKQKAQKKQKRKPKRKTPSKKSVREIKGKRRFKEDKRGSKKKKFKK